VANTLIATVLHLEADSPRAGDNMYIKASGGDLPSLLAVYDTMQNTSRRRSRRPAWQGNRAVGAGLLAAGTPGGAP